MSAEKIIAYCSETGGFFPLAMKDAYIASGTWPESAVMITAEEQQTLLAGQATGKQFIIALPCGTPSLSEENPIKGQVKIEANLLRKGHLLNEAKHEIGPLQLDMYLGCISDEDAELARKWSAYLQELRAIDANTDQNITWPTVPDSIN